jgi:putative nucleotidyltransferase with HDIG domain
VRDLPPLPAVVLELLDMLGREEVETHALATKISHDQALTAKTLRLANSSFYGVSRHVTSVTDATSVLGLRTVRTVITAAALTGNFKAPVCEGFDFAAFWRHAVSSAASAKLLASAVGLDAEAAFTAGLLHDIGQLVLASAYSERFAQVLAFRSCEGVELREAEQALLGTDHAAVGALVAEAWHFPSQIVTAIRNHHSVSPDTEDNLLAATVRMAGRLAEALEHKTGSAQSLALGRDAGIEFGISADAWLVLALDAEVQTQAICAALLN